jgi:hypothetical protein
MRYKEHTINKINGQIMKLHTLQRSIEINAISGPEAINSIETICRDLKTIVQRLNLESDE